MHKPESVLEKQTHKILWDFKVQIDHSILAKRSDLMFINQKKRTRHLVDFTIPADHCVKIKEKI